MGNSFYFGIFLLVIVIVWEILKHMANGGSKGSGDAAVSAPSAVNAAGPSGEVGNAAPRQVVIKSTSPGNIAAGILIAIVMLGVVMWGWGFLEAKLDVSNGMNLIQYAMKVQHMNPITRDGYDTYMECFTDFGKRREQMRKFFE